MNIRQLNRFLLFRMPVAWLAGLRVRAFGGGRTELSLRHGWLNQNPFGSVYFGVLVSGGELATGIPLFAAVRASDVSFSMLVISHRSEFYKKATGRIRFVFEDHGEIARHLDRARRTGEPVSFELGSAAYNASGEVVARFWYQWSVKRRS